MGKESSAILGCYLGPRAVAWTQQRRNPIQARKPPAKTPAAKAMPIACNGLCLTACCASSIASSAAWRPCLKAWRAERTHIFHRKSTHRRDRYTFQHNREEEDPLRIVVSASTHPIRNLTLHFVDRSPSCRSEPPPLQPAASRSGLRRHGD
jgi:hypothetical protein